MFLHGIQVVRCLKLCRRSVRLECVDFGFVVRHSVRPVCSPKESFGVNVGVKRNGKTSLLGLALLSCL